ncbi:MAG: TonB C-terminal domain-containing protein [Candidatus Melainabacteria bacterium]|nr:TonB C-terminal domain-containing protein [Candidatus Melainabacteria bacterium]
MNFLARLYERGTGESIAATVSFQDDTVLIYLEENGNEPIAVRLDEWEVRVGGSSEDKILLYAMKTGDTLICGDEHFLTSIAEATNNQDIIKQIARAKKKNSTRLVRQSTGLVAVIVCLTMFVGCVGVSFLAPRHHYSRHNNKREIETTQESADESAGENAGDGVEETAEGPVEDFDGGKYMQSIQGKIKRAWHPPASSKPTKVVVHFTVDKSGRTSHAKIAKSSGDKACDASALKAISDVSPLPRLGAGSPPNVQIEYTFDLNGKSKKANSPSPPESQGPETEERRYD